MAGNYEVSPTNSFLDPGPIPGIPGIPGASQASLVPGLVHKEAGPHALLQCLPQHRLSLHGAAFDTVHHHHGAIGDAQGCSDLRMAIVL